MQQTHIVVLSEVHSHNIPQSEASLEKTKMSFKAEISKQITSQDFSFMLTSMAFKR